MIIVLALGAVFAFYYLYLYSPIQTQIKQTEEELALNEKQLETTISMIEKIPELKEEYNTLKYIEDSEDKYKEINPEEYLKIINDITRETGTKLLSFNPNQTDSGVKYRMSIEGFYNSASKFLSRLKEMETRFSYEQLDIKPNDDKIELNIQLFYKFKDNGGDKT